MYVLVCMRIRDVWEGLRTDEEGKETKEGDSNGMKNYEGKGRGRRKTVRQ